MTRRLLILTLVLVGGSVWLCRDHLWPRDDPPPPTKTAEIPYVREPLFIEGAELRRLELLASLAAAPAQGAPAALPWYAIMKIGQEGLYPLENLLAADPTLFLEMCLRRYRQEIQGYSLIFRKRERLAGKLQPPEKLECHFREEPFSVHMHWLEGAGRAKKVLYVAGQNNNMMLARPTLLGGFVPIMTRAPDGDEAKAAGRYTINQFGFFQSTQRSLASMRRAQVDGHLYIHYAGTVRVPELGDRVCYKFVRTPYVPLEEEGVNELTLYFDTETWLQVGSVLRDAKGEFIAEYFFRDVRLNPQFKDNQFTRGAL